MPKIPNEVQLKRTLIEVLRMSGWVRDLSKASVEEVLEEARRFLRSPYGSYFSNDGPKGEDIPF